MSFAAPVVTSWTQTVSARVDRPKSGQLTSPKPLADRGSSRQRHDGMERSD